MTHREGRETRDIPESVLLASARPIGIACDQQNENFYRCKETLGDHPARCLKEGRIVTECALQVIEQLNKSCSETFQAYSYCLERNHNQLPFCRDQAQEFTRCYRTLPMFAVDILKEQLERRRLSLKDKASPWIGGLQFPAARGTLQNQNASQNEQKPENNLPKEQQQQQQQ